MADLARIETQESRASGPPILSARGLSKRFGSTRALHEVDIDLTPGRVHALLGTNGCGKSTLVKVLAGVHTADAGHVEWHGSDPAIAFVHQDLGLIGPMSVAENLVMASAGGYRMTNGRIDWARGRAEARKVMNSWGLDIDPDRAVETYGPAEQTMIAVARALSSLPEHGGVLVLDEPTARLPVTEADALVDTLAELKSHAVSILYISHRIDEVMRLADEITILRDGARVYHGITDMDRDELVRLVVGETVTAVEKAPRRQKGRPILHIENLWGMRLEDITLDVGQGEVLGIAGLVGSGRSELARTIYGHQSSLMGRIVLDGQDMTHASISRRMRAGMGYVPQTRAQGLLLSMDIADNITIAKMRDLMRGARISERLEDTAARDIVKRMQIKIGGMHHSVATLSGGNQQKVALGKWMRRDLSLLVLDEPTQGIDVGARTEIFRTIRKLAETQNVGVLVLDSDLEILAEFCNRVVTMATGRIRDSFDGDDLTPAALERAVYGH